MTAHPAELRAVHERTGAVAAFGDERALASEQADRQLWDWDRFRRRYLQAAETIDFLLTPACLEPAPLHRAITGEDFIFTLPASLTGSPAVAAIPAGTDARGLLLAVQFIGRPWEDHRVLAAARLLER